MGPRVDVGGRRHTDHVDDAPALAARGTELLLDVAAAVPGAAKKYDTLLYPVLYVLVKRRGRALASDAARAVGAGPLGVPAVPACDVESIANDVAVHALERARANANRFDPSRGDGASWAIRQASFSYVDVVRSTYGSRRAAAVIPVDDADLEAVSNRRSPGLDPGVVVEMRAALDAALGSLSPQERFVVLSTRHHGYTYVETAELLFGDPSQVRRVERLLRTAQGSLLQAQREWQRELGLVI